MWQRWQSAARFAPPLSAMSWLRCAVASTTHVTFTTPTAMSAGTSRARRTERPRPSRCGYVPPTAVAKVLHVPHVRPLAFLAPVARRTKRMTAESCGHRVARAGVRAVRRARASCCWAAPPTQHSPIMPARRRGPPRRRRIHVKHFVSVSVAQKRK